MAFLYHKLTRRFLLILILLWSVFSFWSLNSTLLSQIAVSCIGLISLIFILLEVGSIFLVIFLSFTSSYSLFGLFSTRDLPTWLFMVAILVIFGYLFTYMEQKMGILGNQRLIYLVLFALVILEVFLALTYFQINPLSLSLIISVVCYLFIGFCFSVLAQRHEAKLSNYLVIAGVVIGAVLATSTWSI